MHQFRGFGVDQIAVLDRAHAAANRARNRTARVRMRHHVSIGRLRFGDDRANFVLGVLRIADRIGWRRHAARRHDLDLRRALLDLFAHGEPHRIHAIDYARNRARAECARTRLEHVAARPEIAVTAGLRQRLTGRENPRTGNQPAFECLRQTPIRAARIAHAGETAAEHRLQNRQRANCGENIRLCRVHAEVRARSQHMDVAIDQARHHRLAASVDHARVRQIDGTVGDFDDMAVFYHNMMVFQQRYPGPDRVRCRR